MLGGRWQNEHGKNKEVDNGLIFTLYPLLARIFIVKSTRGMKVIHVKNYSALEGTYTFDRRYSLLCLLYLISQEGKGESHDALLPIAQPSILSDPEFYDYLKLKASPLFPSSSHSHPLLNAAPPEHPGASHPC